MSEIIKKFNTDDVSQPKVSGRNAPNYNDNSINLIPREIIFQNALEDARRNIRQVKIDPDDYGEIWGICNSTGEYLEMESPIPVTAHIEDWMSRLEFSMKHSVSGHILKCW